MLKLAASVFDPLGVLGPVLLQAKILLQEAWRRKLDWDDKLPKDLAGQWKQWSQSLQQLPEVSIPRWIEDKNSDSQELHVFCDASQKGYGAVAYLRIQDPQDESGKMKLIAAKSRVAPIHLVSLPRLELLACVIGGKLGQHIQKAWSSSKPIYYWTGSKVALHWIQSSTSKWKLFVARRVKIIQELTDFSQWRHCKGTENPADVLSRGCTLQELLCNNSWWTGIRAIPKKKAEEEEKEVLDLAKAEMQKTEEVQVHVTTERVQELMNEHSFSTWKRLVRVTAWVMRFIRNCRSQSQNRIKEKSLNAQEWKAAEVYWIKRNQEENFAEEKRKLLKKEFVSRQSRLKQLSPFLDDQKIIRLGGRLEKAHLSMERKHPMILGTGRVTELIILDRHEALMHGGVQEVMVELRARFWILRGRQEVKKALHLCLKCRRWKARPGIAIEAPLPRERVTKSKAFSVVGTDFFGPLWIKTEDGEKKVYGCIFTCAVTRAIHLELVTSQETGVFLLALRRFLARRGSCEIIWSDNAQTFKQSDKMLQALFLNLREKEIQDFAAQKRIVWKFIAPKASWWGGFYERMIGTVKQHLRKTLGKAKLREEELRTVITEVEAIVNSRPLTYISEEPSELDYLSPGMFLLQQAGVGLPGYKKFIPEFPKQIFVKRWRYQTRLLEGLWKRWSKDYLLLLRTAHQNRVTGTPREIQEGDVVIIMQDRQPKGMWKLGRIIEMTAGRDGKIRSVLLKIASGEILRRAIQQICPLEILRDSRTEESGTED